MQLYNKFLQHGKQKSLVSSSVTKPPSTSTLRIFKPSPRQKEPLHNTLTPSPLQHTVHHHCNNIRTTTSTTSQLPAPKLLHLPTNSTVTPILTHQHQQPTQQLNMPRPLPSIKKTTPASSSLSTKKRVAIQSPTVSPQKDMTPEDVTMQDMGYDGPQLTPTNLEHRFNTQPTYKPMTPAEARAKVATDEWKTEWDHPQILNELLSDTPPNSIDVLPYRTSTPAQWSPDMQRHEETCTHSQEARILSNAS